MIFFLYIFLYISFGILTTISERKIIGTLCGFNVLAVSFLTFFCWPFFIIYALLTKVTTGYFPEGH